MPESKISERTTKSYPSLKRGIFLIIVIQIIFINQGLFPRPLPDERTPLPYRRRSGWGGLMGGIPETGRAAHGPARFIQKGNRFRSHRKAGPIWQKRVRPHGWKRELVSIVKETIEEIPRQGH
jgi:hypothetical protein